jgi:DNA-binding beta-propeller fold protein YncE
MKKFVVLSLVVMSGLLLPTARTQTAARLQVGPLPGGGFLLNSGWTIHPAGEQTPVGTFPMSSAVSNNGKFLLVLNAGYEQPSISVIDTASKKDIGRTKLADAWLGLAVAPQGNSVYVGGGTTGKVLEFSLDPATGALLPTRELVAVPDLANKANALIGDVALSPDARLLYAANLYGDTISVLNLQSGKRLDTWKTGRRPYRILVTPSGKQLIISSWADAALYQHEAATGILLTKVRVGAHPTDLLWVNKPSPSQEGAAKFPARLFVAAANTNSVYSFGAAEDGQLAALETINVSLTPMHPLGMTPSALAANEAGTRLYIVCSDANAVAEADISSLRSRVLGFIPTGWYPTAITVLKDGAFAMLNGKGLGSHPAAEGQSGGRIQAGTAAFLPAPSDDELSVFTQTTLRNSPYKDEMIYGPNTDDQENYFTRSEGHASPVQHVIYVIKEGHTYDEVLGDMGTGNGDKSLTHLGQQVTPNLHQLARDYILYDNFYVNADVSADGNNWASAAIAPDYTTKLSPSQYGRRSTLYDFEGGEPANTPPAGYLWNNALQAGLTIRDYGQWCSNIPLKDATGSKHIAAVKDAALLPFVDMNYRGFDVAYSDADRAKEFIREWKEFDAKGDAPNLLILRMGNDHTMGAKASPLSYAADNDQGVGMLVDAVSHSKLWPSTAVFIIEDSAQYGSDHVDSHRAPVWVISPYTRRGIVDSSMYNQTSVLRTMEMLLGLRPMTHFDAAARPLFATFGRQPDTRAYDLLAPGVTVTGQTH